MAQARHPRTTGIQGGASMIDTIFKALPCKLSKGGMGCERLVELNVIPYKGLIQYHWCWNKEGKLLRENEANDNHVIDGFVAVKVVEEDSAGKVRVAFPTEWFAEYIEIDESLLVDRPTGVGNNVSVQS
jgi:hypothetical protein